jgi:hypothetical protein
MKLHSFMAVLTCALILACVARAEEPKPNTLTDQEKQEGWKLMFDGTTSAGWKQLGGKAFPTKGWEIVDGAFHLKEKGGGGDLQYLEKVEDFEVQFEWKIPKGSNTGVKYRVQDVPGNTFAFGCEYQVIDDTGNADAKGARHMTGALYDVFPPAAQKKLNPPGEWNHSKIVVKGNHGEHWLNGQKVLEFDFSGLEWDKAVAKSKFKGSNKFANPALGYITIQDHKEECWFRSLKLKAMAGEKK